MNLKSLLSAVLVTFVSASAISAPGQIKSLNCTGSSFNSTTKITFSGMFAGKSYINITNVPTFGFPFSQQAEIVDADYIDGVLSLNLHTVLTNSKLILELEPQSTQGSLRSPGEVKALAMKCSADIIVP